MSISKDETPVASFTTFRQHWFGTVRRLSEHSPQQSQLPRALHLAASQSIANAHFPDANRNNSFWYTLPADATVQVYVGPQDRFPAFRRTFDVSAGGNNSADTNHGRKNSAGHTPGPDVLPQSPGIESHRTTRTGLRRISNRRTDQQFLLRFCRNGPQRCLYVHRKTQEARSPEDV